MPRNRKCFIHGSVIEIGFRIEEGLLLPPTLLMRMILIGLLARAQRLYPMQICHYIVMSNHIHLLAVVQDPNDVPRFLEYFKRESAHAINRMLGRSQRTVWSAGYDSPTVLDAEKMIQRIVYIYTNPQQARLEREIEKYPNLNSWSAFLAGGADYEVPYFPRTAVPRALVAGEGNSISLATKMRKKSVGMNSLIISPNAWLKCFEQSDGWEEPLIREQVIAAVREKERELDLTYGKNVLSAETLLSSELQLDFIPKKRSKRMICLGSTKEIRGAFVGWFKDAAGQACVAVRSWISGPIGKIPPGFFAPGGKLHSYLNPIFTPLPLA